MLAHDRTSRLATTLLSHVLAHDSASCISVCDMSIQEKHAPTLAHSLAAVKENLGNLVSVGE